MAYRLLDEEKSKDGDVPVPSPNADADAKDLEEMGFAATAER